MNKLFILFLSALIFFFALISPVLADLDGFLSSLNNQARADMPRYHAALGEEFKIPPHKVDWVLQKVQEPADAFMCLQLGLMSGLGIEQVVKTYNTARGKGWGVIARELGIKPGSPEFHALKQGDFFFFGVGGKNKPNKPGKGKSQGKGKAKGKNK